VIRAYAIGDIHGHVDKLLKAHDLIEEDRRAQGDPGAPIVHVGDLVDRGPDSRGVVAHLMDGRARGENWVVLKGNHDRMFERFMVDPVGGDSRLRDGLSWLHPALGGRATLESYGVKSTVYDDPWDVYADAVTLVPKEHVDFLESLPLSFRLGPLFFAHAGVRPGVPLTAQSEDDLLWIRREFHEDSSEHGALVIHGHTPVKAATNYGNRVNVDSGAAFGGPLSAVVLEDRDVWLLTTKGRERMAVEFYDPR
jgi:serine/threonine protein phosphatase 1